MTAQYPIAQVRTTLGTEDLAQSLVKEGQLLLIMV